MTTSLLVPEAHHGGWWDDPLVQRLQAAGHTAAALVLLGVTRAARSQRTTITVEDHVAQAVAHLRATPVRGTAPDVVLVGHSHGDSLITAVADAEPDRSVPGAAPAEGVRRPAARRRRASCPHPLATTAARARADEQLTVHTSKTTQHVLREGRVLVLVLVAVL